MRDLTRDRIRERSTPGRGPTRRRVVALSVLFMAALLMCKRGPSEGAPESAPADRFSQAGMLHEAAQFVADAKFRRRALEQAFTNPKNTYSNERLTHYGFENRGWDLLPEWNPKSVPLTRAMAQQMLHGAPLSAPESLWDGRTPAAWEEWVALGREVFFRYPLRSEVFVQVAVHHPTVAERYGVHAARDGTLPGLVAFVDDMGQKQLGLTCALCHSSVTPQGDVLVGAARRDFDFGALRLAYAEQSGTRIEPGLAGRFHRWGPGRADVTEDDDEDPVAIPDLWGLKHQKFLTQAGTIRHDGPAALMLRQETQLLTANHQKTRPPRVLAAALALYVYSLEPPASLPPTEATVAGLAPHGKDLFREHCSRCHSNAAGGGDLVSHAIVGTDSALALGAARGTGHYRPPALIRVRFAAPYLHHGAVGRLQDLLDPARFSATYQTALGEGPVPGHSYGTELAASDRAALLAYLETL